MNRLEARTQLRREIQDRIDTSALSTNPPSHLSRFEPSIPITGSIDSVNVKFRVRHYPLLTDVQGGVETLIQVIDQLGTAFVVDPLTTDYLRGVVALTTAPVQNVSKKILITYFSQWYTDDELNAFLAQAADFLQTGATEITDDVTLYGFDPGLKPAFQAYARYLVFDSLSTKSADFFDYSAGGKTENKASVPKAYEAKAKRSYDEANDLRETFYQRQGRRNVPAMGFVTPAQRGQPFTPPR